MVQSALTVLYLGTQQNFVNLINKFEKKNLSDYREVFLFIENLFITLHWHDFCYTWCKTSKTLNYVYLRYHFNHRNRDFPLCFP